MGRLEWENGTGGMDDEIVVGLRLSGNDGVEFSTLKLILYESRKSIMDFSPPPKAGGKWPKMGFLIS